MKFAEFRKDVDELRDATIGALLHELPEGDRADLRERVTFIIRLAFEAHEKRIEHLLDRGLDGLPLPRADWEEDSDDR